MDDEAKSPHEVFHILHETAEVQQPLTVPAETPSINQEQREEGPSEEPSVVAPMSTNRR